MNVIELMYTSVQSVELLNPSTTEKIISLGKRLKLTDNDEIIEFGCGSGEILYLYSKNFNVKGIGIDIYEPSVIKAKKKLTRSGNSSGRIEVVHTDASKYAFNKHAYDFAFCIGSTYIWKGSFLKSLEVMKSAVKKTGKIIIGDLYWKKQDIPSCYKDRMPNKISLEEIYNVTRQYGYDFEYVEWGVLEERDRYTAEIWDGFEVWLKKNKSHPEKGKVIEFYRECQKDYLTFQREMLDWAIFVLKPEMSV